MRSRQDLHALSFLHFFFSRSLSFFRFFFFGLTFTLVKSIRLNLNVLNFYLLLKFDFVHLLQRQHGVTYHHSRCRFDRCCCVRARVCVIQLAITFTHK